MTNEWKAPAKRKLLQLDGDAKAAHGRYVLFADRLRALSAERNLKAGYLAGLMHRQSFARLGDDLDALNRDVQRAEAALNGLDESIAEIERQMRLAEQAVQPLLGLKEQGTKILINLNVISRAEAGL